MAYTQRICKGKTSGKTAAKAGIVMYVAALMVAVAVIFNFDGGKQVKADHIESEVVTVRTGDDINLRKFSFGVYPVDVHSSSIVTSGAGWLNIKVLPDCCETEDTMVLTGVITLPDGKEERVEMVNDIKTSPATINFARYVPSGTVVTIMSGYLSLGCEHLPCAYLINVSYLAVGNRIADGSDDRDDFFDDDDDRFGDDDDDDDFFDDDDRFGRDDDDGRFDDDDDRFGHDDDDFFDDDDREISSVPNDDIHNGRVESDCTSCHGPEHGRDDDDFFDDDDDRFGDDDDDDFFDDDDRFDRDDDDDRFDDDDGGRDDDDDRFGDDDDDRFDDDDGGRDDDGDDFRGKSFTFRCERGFIIGLAGLEKLVMSANESQSCTLELTDSRENVQIGINHLTFGSESIHVSPTSGNTGTSGVLTFTIDAARRGVDWISWAVPDANGDYDFSLRAYERGLAWGMFVLVR